MIGTGCSYINLAILSGGQPAWVPRDAAALWDFAGDRYWSSGLKDGFSQLAEAGRASFSRASAKHAEDAAGYFIVFPAGTPARTGRGLFLEPARSNEIRHNSRFADAGAAVGAIGAGGALPSGWSWSSFPWLTREVVGLGTTAEEIDYIDLRWSGTNNAGSTAHPYLFFAPDAEIPMSPGETWTVSCWTALIAGSLSGTTGDAGRIQLRWRSTSGAYNGENSGGETAGADFSRKVHSVATPANSASGSMAMPCAVQNGQSVDFTLRVGWPQMEKAASASSPILTTGRAATRAEDRLTLALPSGTHDLTLTFADGSMQTIADVNGEYTLDPARLARPWIRTIKAARQ